MLGITALSFGLYLSKTTGLGRQVVKIEVYRSLIQERRLGHRLLVERASEICVL